MKSIMFKFTVYCTQYTPDKRVYCRVIVKVSQLRKAVLPEVEVVGDEGQLERPEERPGVFDTLLGVVTSNILHYQPAKRDFKIERGI